MFNRKPKPSNPISITAPSPDRLSMIWVTLSMAIVLLPHLPRLPFWYPVLFILTAGYRLAEVYKRVKPAPTWVRLMITIGGVAGIFAYYGTILGRQAGVALLCVMLALKLLESQRRRDIYLLITISYFVIVTQFLFDQSISLVIYLIAGVIVITGSLLVIEVQPARDLANDQENNFNQISNLMGSAGKLLAQSLPLMLILFLFFPRLSAPIWGVPEDALDNKTGISDEMSPGKISELFIDDSPAFRVYFEGDPPSSEQRYWRGPVLWDFDGTTWQRPQFGLRSPANIDRAAIKNPLSYQIILEPTERNWLFGLDMPLSTPDDGGLQLDHTLYRMRPITELYSYTMQSDPNYILDLELSPLRRKAALALPEGFNPRTETLAKTWLQELGGDHQAMINRALDMFNQQEFIYSFRPPPLGLNTVDDFLFDTRNGYCEYYASSFTALMRFAGIPSRVVTGYQGGYLSTSGDYILVRQSDAHAWSEVWLEGQGWVRVDPTAAVAPERIDLGALQALGSRGAFDYPWLRDLKNRLDTVQNFWNKVVLQFNAVRQSKLFQPLGIDQFSPQYGLIVIIILGVLLSIVLGFFLLRAQQIGGLDKASRHYAKFCNKLAKAGITKSINEGPRDFANRASKTFVRHSGQIERISTLYIQLRYQASSDQQTLDSLAQAVKQFKPKNKPAEA